MWVGHPPLCGCAICQPCSQIAWLLSQGERLPGFNDIAQGLLECTVNSLRQLYLRSVPVGAVNPEGASRGVIGHTPSLLHLVPPPYPAPYATQHPPLARVHQPPHPPAPPPGDFSTSSTTPAKEPAREEPKEDSQIEEKTQKKPNAALIFPKSQPTGIKNLPQTKVKEEPSEDRSQPSKKPVVDVVDAEGDKDRKKKETREKKEHRPGEKSKRSKEEKGEEHKRSRSRGRKKSRSKGRRGELSRTPISRRGGKEKKYKGDKPPEPGHPPPGHPSSSRGSGVHRQEERGQKGGGKSSQGPGWVGRLPPGVHRDRWGKNKGVVKRAKQALRRERYR